MFGRGGFIGRAHAEKLVVAQRIDTVVLQAAVGQNAADVRIVQIREDAAVRIEKLKTIRLLGTIFAACATFLLAHYRPALAPVFATLEAILLVYLAYVQDLAQQMLRTHGATAGTMTAPSTVAVAGTLSARQAASATAGLSTSLQSILVIIALLLLALLAPQVALPAPGVPEPPANPSSAPPPTASSAARQPRPPRQPRRPQTPEEQRVWDTFARSLEEELVKCDGQFDTAVGVTVRYARDFSLTCFQCPDDAFASKLGDAETNAPPELATCYKNAVDNLLYRYVFPMPPGVGILDNHFVHEK